MNKRDQLDRLDRSLGGSRKSVLDAKTPEKGAIEASGIGAALSQFSSHSNGLKRIVSSRKLSKSPSLGHTLNKKGYQVIVGRHHGHSPTIDIKLSPSLTSKNSASNLPDQLLNHTSSNLFVPLSLEDSRNTGSGFFIGSLQDSLHASQSSKANKPQHTSVSTILDAMHNESAHPTSITKLEKNVIHPFNDSHRSISDRAIISKVIQPMKPNFSSERIHERRATTIKSGRSRRKAWVLNPFREQDEEHVLAEYSYSRLRWSHVFPLGEIEFKKKAGPNWKSLCQPAVLPMTIDHFPFFKELNDPSKYTFNHYLITLDAMDDRHYKSHTDLLKEMIVQRLIQNFQLVPHDVFASVTQNVERRGKKW